MLSIDKLAKQKQIFETTLVREIKEELRFIRSIMAGRAKRRPEFEDKVITLITKLFEGVLTLSGVVIGAIPAVSSAKTIPTVGAKVASLAGLAVQHGVNANKSAQIKALGNAFKSFDMEMFEVYLQQFARLASLRYEGVIRRLSSKAGESVMPLAIIGARRVMDHLKRIAMSGTEPHASDTLIALLLDGLIQGHSGKGKDNLFKNHEIKGFKHEMKMTVEGALGRPAMRVLSEGIGEVESGKWPIYYREKAYHVEKGEDKHFPWGRTSFIKHKPKLGPKYGAIFVTKETKKWYRYEDDFVKGVNTHTDFLHFPSVYIASKKDVLEYHKDKASEKVEGSKKAAKQSFLEYIQEQVKLKNPNRKIAQVWVRDDLSKIELTQGDFSKIDFAGCNFNQAKLSHLSLYRANLVFCSAVGITCQTVTCGITDVSC